MNNAGIEFKVKNLLRVALGNASICYEVNEFYDWLRSPNNQKMQLDIYLPDFGVAIEIDGKQHYQFPNTFHKSFDDYLWQNEKDRLKEKICHERKIALIRVRGKLLYWLLIYVDNGLLVSSISRDLVGKLQRVPPNNQTLIAYRNRKAILSWLFSLEDKHKYVASMRLASD